MYIGTYFTYQCVFSPHFYKVNDFSESKAKILFQQLEYSKI